jgi:hypothetical protein
MSASPGFAWGEGPMRGVNIGGWSVVFPNPSLVRWPGGTFGAGKDLLMTFSMRRIADTSCGIDGDYRIFVMEYAPLAVVMNEWLGWYSR